MHDPNHFGFWTLDLGSSTSSLPSSRSTSIQNPKSIVNRQSAISGYTLLELVAALFVLTVGMMGTVTTYHFGLEKIRAMRESAIAVRAAQNEVETLRATPFRDLTDRENAPFISASPDLDQLVHGTPAVTIRSQSGLPLKEVAVSVRWSGDNGRTITKRVTTLIADKESP